MAKGGGRKKLTVVGPHLGGKVGQKKQAKHGVPFKSMGSKSGAKK